MDFSIRCPHRFPYFQPYWYQTVLNTQQCLPIYQQVHAEISSSIQVMCPILITSTTDIQLLDETMLCKHPSFGKPLNLELN